ncbi:hypothetical protein NDU88_007997 [Pleurodeles waltl]|uniref:Uncharacterized protein n=1 Tax=Pleurodeles waltl TaxID=8319 RepID=A0AAV7QPJ0_PLEWA|nr:hypothetical protein NDU88_007997 [Pleurodeles waltl]
MKDPRLSCSEKKRGRGCPPGGTWADRPQRDTVECGEWEEGVAGADTALPTPHLVSRFLLFPSPSLQHSYRTTLLEELCGSTKKTRPRRPLCRHAGDGRGQ